MTEIGVGVIGFGTVGAGVAEGLLKSASLITRRCGVSVELRGVADVDITTDRGVAVPEHLLSTDAMALVARPDIQIVVELIGGTGVAYNIVKAALEAGKAVVTANKKLLAEHGEELFALARERNVDLYFGASVGGGIPIIRSLRDGLVANEILAIYGILNGTCNYILTRMAREGLGFDEVLSEAQRLGYAEANPSLDIDGFDTAHKACILAALAFGFQPKISDVHVEGIRGIGGEDVRYAADFGYRIKLLACVARDGDEVEVGVHPTLVPKTHMLYNVNDAFNAAMVKGDMSDYTMYYGRGAGRAPTASTVVGDIGDIARNIAHGGARYSRAVPTYGEGKMRLKAAGDIRSKFYIRFLVEDRAGAFGTIASILGKHNVSISAASQKAGSVGKEPVPVVALTHLAKSADLDAALDEIMGSGVVGGRPVSFRVL